jgi:hypothetical protein
MADSQDDGAPAGETPMQKALRLKKASLAAKGGPPNRGGKLTDERRAAARSSSQSKPWMKK